MDCVMPDDLLHNYFLPKHSFETVVLQEEEEEEAEEEDHHCSHDENDTDGDDKLLVLASGDASLFVRVPPAHLPFCRSCCKLSLVLQTLPMQPDCKGVQAHHRQQKHYLRLRVSPCVWISDVPGKDTAPRPERIAPARKCDSTCTALAHAVVSKLPRTERSTATLSNLGWLQPSLARCD